MSCQAKPGQGKMVTGCIGQYQLLSASLSDTPVLSLALLAAHLSVWKQALI